MATYPPPSTLASFVDAETNRQVRAVGVISDRVHNLLVCNVVLECMSECKDAMGAPRWDRVPQTDPDYSRLVLIALWVQAGAIAF